MGTTNARGDELTGRFAVNYCPVDTFCEAGLNPIDDFDFGTNGPRVAAWLEARYEAIDEVGDCYLVAKCGGDSLDLVLFDRNCCYLAELSFAAPEDEVPAATFVAFLATCEAWRALATGEFTTGIPEPEQAATTNPHRLVLGSGAGADVIEAHHDTHGPVLFTVNDSPAFTASALLDGYKDSTDWPLVFEFAARLVFADTNTVAQATK